MESPSAIALRSDADLLAGVIAQQPEGLAELYDRYGAMAFGLAVRMLGDAARAEECVQAVFLDLWRQREPPGGELGAWLLSAVHRAARARQRAVAPDTAYPRGAAIAPGPRPDRPPAPARSRAHAHSLLVGAQKQARAARAHLPAAERAVLELAYFEGRTVPEIAAALQEAPTMVRTRIHSGLQHLAAGLAADYQPRAANAASPDPNGGTPPMRVEIFGGTYALAAETGTHYQAVVYRSPSRGGAVTGDGEDAVRDAARALLAPPPAGESAADARQDRRQDQILILLEHELKAPITVVRATIQLVSRRLRAAGQLEEAARLDSAVSQVDRLTALVNCLLRAGQLSSSAVDLYPVRFDLAGLVREVGAGMQELSALHEVIVAAPAHLEVEGDADRLTQVLRNLIANAIKYSPAGGAVEVTLCRAGADAELCVRDYGIGIPVADREQVFDRFHRAANVGAIPGFGLGLALSRAIVGAHHGRLWVGDVPTVPGTGATPTETSATEDGRGSLLCLTLPLTQEAGARIPAAPIATPERSSRAERRIGREQLPAHDGPQADKDARIAALQERVAELEAAVRTAHTDPRFAILTRFGIEQRWHERPAYADTALFIDVDRVHDLNERWGYGETDNRIAAVMRQVRDYWAFRWFSGDEFGLVCAASDAVGFATRIQALLTEQGMSATFGIAPIVDGHLETSMARASALAQAAKAVGRRGTINQ